MEKAMASNNLDVRDRRLLDVTGSEIGIEQLAAGMASAKARCGTLRGAGLIFSDMKQTHMPRVEAGEGITPSAKPSNKANGNTYEPGTGWCRD